MKITKLMTMRLPEFPLSCFLFVHTDDGLVGLGESTNLAGSIEGADIAEALPSVVIDGVTGSISFDEIGDANKDMAYIKQANNETGEFDFIKTQSVADLG